MRIHRHCGLFQTRQVGQPWAPTALQDRKLVLAWFMGSKTVEDQILDHFETMVETIVCWHLQENHNIYIYIYIYLQYTYIYTYLYICIYIYTHHSVGFLSRWCTDVRRWISSIRLRWRPCVSACPSWTWSERSGSARL